MQPFTNDSTPSSPIGGVYMRPAGARLADYKKATVDAMFSAAGADELRLMVGVETVTTEDAEGDSKKDSFRKKSVLYTTNSGSAVSFRTNAEGWNEMKALFDAGNVDLFYISGSVTESSTAVAVDDSVMGWYDLPITLGKPTITENSYDVTITWETDIATGATGPFVWEKVIADS